MKRNILVFFFTLLVMSLPACGGASEPAQEPPELTPVPMDFFDTPLAEVEKPASLTEDTAPAEAEDTEAEAPAQEPAPAYDEAAYQAALACIGRPAEELYAALGEPDSAEYAASCLVEDAEDGMLYYDGFYVWTVKTDAEELVHDVYLNE